MIHAKDFLYEYLQSTNIHGKVIPPKHYFKYKELVFWYNAFQWSKTEAKENLSVEIAKINHPEVKNLI